MSDDTLTRVPDAHADDMWTVCCRTLPIGRMSLARLAFGRTIWRWSLTIAAPQPNWARGEAETFEAAREGFAAAWQQWQAHAGPQGVEGAFAHLREMQRRADVWLCHHVPGRAKKQ